MKNYFSEAELACQHCGKYHFADEFLYILNVIRGECGFALPVTSGYRCDNHPIEAAKERRGAHNRGLAVDIACHGGRAMRLIEAAVGQGIPRIGVNQRGDLNSRFIHLDIDSSLPSPTIWSY